MPCPNCATPTPDQATQCPTCGVALVAASSQPGWGAPPSPPPWGPPGGAAPPPGPQGYAPYPQPGPQQWGQQQWGQQQQQWGQPQWGQPQGYDRGPGGNGQLAGWWRRFLATLIDIILLGVVGGIIGTAAGHAVEYGVGFVLGLAYTAGLLATRGQTVGMMALRTKCVNESSGQLISPGASVGRYLLAELLGLTVIGGILDILWPLWDANNQTIHDKAVKSLVVKTR
jgi:uncharacterized RDD family membrane protein YckC